MSKIQVIGIVSENADEVVVDCILHGDIEAHLHMTRKEFNQIEK